MWVFWPACMPVHCCIRAVWRGQKRALEPLELELKKVVAVMEVLGKKPGTSGRAAASVFDS